MTARATPARLANTPSVESASVPAAQRYRVLAVPSHPVPYAAGSFRELARHPRIDFESAFCSMAGAVAALDPEFETVVHWDSPLLEGFRYCAVPNWGNGGLGFWGLCNPRLWGMIRKGRHDAVLLLTGYRRASFWIAYAAARSRGIPVFFGTDASRLESRDGANWKLKLKRQMWPLLFGLADQVIVVSTPGREMMESLGIPAERIALLHNVVDNQWWIEESRRVNREAARERWGVREHESLVVFCAKLQEWKRPMDLVRSFAAAAVPSAKLIFAGEGPLRESLESQTAALGIADRVRFPGFVNQSGLPELYTAADLMVLPSEYEPFAMVVNEAMLCGCPAAVSDRVGSARDLVAPVAPELVFPCGDCDALAATLRYALADPLRLRRWGLAARARMETWSPRENAAGVLAAIERVRAMNSARAS